MLAHPSVRLVPIFSLLASAMLLISAACGGAGEPESTDSAGDQQDSGSAAQPQATAVPTTTSPGATPTPPAGVRTFASAV